MRSILSISVTLAIFMVSFTNVSGKPINANIALTKRLAPGVDQVGSIVSGLSLNSLPLVGNVANLAQTQKQGQPQPQGQNGQDQTRQGQFGQPQNPK